MSHTHPPVHNLFTSVIILILLLKGKSQGQKQGVVKANGSERSNFHITIVHRYTDPISTVIGSINKKTHNQTNYYL